MKLSEEFEEKFKGVMQHDNAIQFCESVFDWLQEKEREGEIISLEGVISVLNDRKNEIDKIWSIAQDGGHKEASETCQQIHNAYTNVIGDLKTNKTT